MKLVLRKENTIKIISFIYNMYPENFYEYIDNDLTRVIYKLDYIKNEKGYYSFIKEESIFDENP